MRVSRFSVTFSNPKRFVHEGWACFAAGGGTLQESEIWIVWSGRNDGDSDRLIAGRNAARRISVRASICSALNGSLQVTVPAAVAWYSGVLIAGQFSKTIL